ncbi:hypothetical protein SAICODRAFT_31931 [Saitoella complicata NRRL Y-17804]|uniref:Uncharacterized protein n=1 Tax=Saitoella complicata (strain BCRC 22490 / CBS 7301 / JCM 7358 / NBRC 10748 / NRRL Y-17804) TaxID=698492 RepID=A0A0E9NN80_SAICN|nr:uncharacterized protein SAICODRAFT_31931 [Saitoella complicata NRRL Y-17804]ODQ50389.1 hypothetical protein SAICODRAFT_31931 [Saitoella complicata NRRL Y-17804]GAO51141.1 hypothetical protein G7K_5252-t1 [Saitoella complicata NRRL Y-17804]
MARTSKSTNTHAQDQSQNHSLKSQPAPFKRLPGVKYIDDVPYSKLLHDQKPIRRAQIVILHQMGYTNSVVEKERLVARSTLKDTLSRYAKTKTYRDLPRGGRPKSYTEREERELVRSEGKGRHRML